MADVIDAHLVYVAASSDGIVITGDHADLSALAAHTETPVAVLPMPT